MAAPVSTATVPATEGKVEAESKPETAAVGVPSNGAGGYDRIDAQEVADISVKRVRLTYGALLILGFILCLLAKLEVAEWIAKWAIKKDGSCTSSECVGFQGVYRISFALFLFFFFHWAISSPWNLCLDAPGRIKFNQGFIFFKIVALAPFLLLSYLIPNDFFVFFAWCCLIASVIFLVGQLIVLLEFAYSWSDDWVNREESKFQVGLMVCTVAMVVGAIVFVALSYAWYGASSSCSANQAVTSITLVAALFYFPLSIAAPHGSLLPSATVFIYTAYTCFSALSMTPEGECNTIHTSGWTQLIIGALFSAISLVYMTVSAGTSRSAFQIRDNSDETVEEAEAASFSFFHVQMMLGSCYLAMLMTNWSIIGSNKLAEMQGDARGPMWAKFASEMMCIVLYIWTLVAPMICKDRDFG